MTPPDKSFLLIETRKVYEDGSTGRTAVEVQFDGTRITLDPDDPDKLRSGPTSKVQLQAQFPRTLDLPTLARIHAKLREVEDSPR
jgi:hypothetical protein